MTDEINIWIDKMTMDEARSDIESLKEELEQLQSEKPLYPRGRQGHKQMNRLNKQIRSLKKVISAALEVLVYKIKKEKKNGHFFH